MRDPLTVVVVVVWVYVYVLGGRLRVRLDSQMGKRS